MLLTVVYILWFSILRAHCDSAPILAYAFLHACLAVVVRPLLLHAGAGPGAAIATLAGCAVLGRGEDVVWNAVFYLVLGTPQ